MTRQVQISIGGSRINQKKFKNQIDFSGFEEAQIRLKLYVYPIF